MAIHPELDAVLKLMGKPAKTYNAAQLRAVEDRAGTLVQRRRKSNEINRLTGNPEEAAISYAEAYQQALEELENGMLYYKGKK